MGAIKTRCPHCPKRINIHHAYIVQSRELREYCCGEAHARDYVRDNPRNGPWIILPPTLWTQLEIKKIERFPTEEEQRAWKPILLNEKGAEL